MGKIVFSVLFFGLLYLFVVALFQRKFVFPRQYTQEQLYKGEAPRVIYSIQSDEGRVESWFLRSSVGENQKKPVVVFAHGNAELIDQWPVALKRYLEMGVHVYLPEYRGYGRSEGSPTRKKIAQDMQMFYDWVAGRDDVDPEKIVLHGRSLGGGVVADLGRTRAFQALILQSTFLDIGLLSKKMFVPGFLLMDRFETRSLVERMQEKYLVVHGRSDQVVPFVHAEQLLALKPEQASAYFYQGDHGLVGLQPDKYWAAIEKFLRQSGVLNSP